MSIDPGEGWKVLRLRAEPPVCTPTLIGKAGVINSLSLQEYTDIKQAADFLQTQFGTTSKVVPDSFKQEEFTTVSGLKGIHLSYTATSKNGTSPDLRSHSFITHAMLGSCVSISYITSPTDESAVVLESISKTLQVE